MSPKEIAERIISGDIFNVSKPITDLARAYLELEYRHKMAKERIERDRHRIGEITKLKEELERLRRCLSKINNKKIGTDDSESDVIDQVKEWASEALKESK